VLVRARVNGEWQEADVWPGSSLLTLLRDGMGLFGTKNACEQGECGSCSVWMDGEVVNSCLVLAAQAEGREIGTVEGMAPERGDGELHPVQEAFVETGAVQCGFCTPGLLVAVADLLERDPDPDEETVREALAGNLCRCTGYQKILDAVALAGERMRTAESLR
jgi:aerobic carbon-monoxide dehydrogenase small subunit